MEYGILGIRGYIDILYSKLTCALSLTPSVLCDMARCTCDAGPLPDCVPAGSRASEGKISYLI